MVFIPGGLWKKGHIPGKILQAPCVKISVEDCVQDILERFSVESAAQDPCVRPPVQVSIERSPQNIFGRNLQKKKGSVQGYL